MKRMNRPINVNGMVMNVPLGIKEEITQKTGQGCDVSFIDTACKWSFQSCKQAISHLECPYPLLGNKTDFFPLQLQCLVSLGDQSSELCIFTLVY